MDPLNIRSKTMLATHHSWSVTMRSLIEQFIKLGHNPFLTSTNGQSLIPEEWSKYIDKEHDSPDIDICYTLPRNFKRRFVDNSKLKMSIYNYESSIVPAEWKDELSHLDYVLPSSNFSKEIFVSNGWPEDKCIVIPHGINPIDFEDRRTVKLSNNRSFRFLNISIPHYRKNIDLMVEAYYSAFDFSDDVCLVLKTNLKKPKLHFEADIAKQITDVQVKFKDKKLPMIEIVQERLDSIVPLYNSCQVLVSATSSEGFGLPFLEALAADMIVVAPRCTGQLDFLNDDNSLLVDVKEVSAGTGYQYWRPSPKATTFKPIVDSLSQNMLDSYNKYREVKDKVEEGRLKTIEKFTWENAAKQILEIK